MFLLVVDEYQEKPKSYWQERFEGYQPVLDSILDVLEAGERIAWVSQEGLVVLCFEADAAKISKDRQKAIAEQLLNTIAFSVPEVKISLGIAEPAANINVIGARYRQARTAVSVGQKVWPQSQIHHYLDTGVFQLLSCVTDEAQITEYIERTLGKLLRYDKKKNEAFLETLEVILMSDNLRESATKLSIHYQTLIFRKQRLEAILEVSLEDFSVRLAMSTALQLLKIRKH